MYSMNFDGET